MSLGRLFLKRGDIPKALEALHEALAIAQEIRAKPKAYQANQVLSEAYERRGDLTEALRHHRRFHEIKEGVFSNEANAQLKHLQTRFEVQKTEREAEITRLKNVELEEKNNQRRGLLQELRATQTQLIHWKKVASRGKLVAGIAHELNSPLGATLRLRFRGERIPDQDGSQGWSRPGTSKSSIAVASKSKASLEWEAPLQSASPWISRSPAFGTSCSVVVKAGDSVIDVRARRRAPSSGVAGPGEDLMIAGLGFSVDYNDTTRSAAATFSARTLGVR